MSIHHMTLRATGRLASLMSLLFAACESAPPPRAPMLGAVDTLNAPVGVNSAEPNVTAAADGRVWLSWLERAADSTTSLRIAAFDGAAWSPPATVISRRDLFVNWADFPSLHVAPSGTLVAHWLQRSGTGKYAYDVHVSLSTDGGSSWSTPAILHRDRSAAEHGFVSLFTGAGDSITAVWLDGRKYPDATSADEMQLISTTLSPTGSLGGETIVDARICDCCQTDAALTTRGPVIVYRDRSDAEIRDIYAVRRDTAGWGTPTTVHADGWKIPGCPVNGPAAAARGDIVAVAWFTAAQDTARVRLAYSFDAGTTFNPPLRIDAGWPVGRVDVQMGDSGQAIIAWMERSDSANAEVRVRVAEPNGALSPPVVLASTAASRASGFPRMALQRLGNENSLIVAWTVPGDTSRVQVARVRLRPTERENP